MKHHYVKVLLASLILLGISCSPKSGKINETPNILWISCEDITTMLSCYGDPNARTPHLDEFAKKSVLYSNAFATAPVCSPSRSCIVTGMYATTIGTQHLRSHTNIPKFVVPFPKYLKEAGYYVTNNKKEDYNFTDESIWDESAKTAHWRNRREGQPFFSVFNLGITHQSGIIGNDSVYESRIREFLPFVGRTNPDSVVLPSYYPDTPGIRKLWARYYTNVSIVDYQFSQRLKQLEEDGLMDNTIVFFFSDHGTGMPRSKRALYDSGLKIPLLIHVPAMWRAKFNMDPGTVKDQMVSFIDFAPTILEIAGVDIPDHFQGRSFISGTTPTEKPYVYGASDRVDEAYEMSRTIRTKKYRYTRNFMPFLPLLQPNFYTDQSEIMSELDKVDVSTLSDAQLTLFQPRRMPEELYNVVDDPHEVNNLAANPAYQDVLGEFRETMKLKILETHDTALMPEPEMIRLSKGITTYHLAHDHHKFPIHDVLSACDLMLAQNITPDTVIRYLNHPNGFVRYWTLIAIQTLGVWDERFDHRLKDLLEDDFPTVQMESAKLLVQRGNYQALSILDHHLKNDDHIALYAARTYQLLSPGIKHFSEAFNDAFNQLEMETNEGSLSTENHYKLYADWAISEILN